MRVYRRSHCISVVSAIAIALGGVTACGGSSDEVVAQVAGVGSVSKSMVEHWIPIQARLIYQVVPTRPVPRGVVPDPPTYTACIAYLQTTKQKIAETGPRATTAELRRKCAVKYQEMKANALNLLITWDWTIGQGLRAGMKVSDAEARQRIEALKKGDLAGVDFKKYLKYTGQTQSDMLLRAKVQLFEVKLNQRLQAMAKQLPKGLTAQQQRAAMAKLAATLLTDKQWAARTSCSSGYVTSSCKQYKGPLPPGAPS